MDTDMETPSISEIVFEVCEDIYDGGYSASAIGFGIHTQGDTVEELRHNIMEAIDCHFDDPTEHPGFVRFHYVRDDVVAV